MGEPIHAGIAASAGVEAVNLAKKGFISASDSLDGPQGFAANHLGEQNSDALYKLGKVFLLDQVCHKFRTCCHGTHAMIEAIKMAKSDKKICPANVEKVEITVHPQYLNICNLKNLKPEWRPNLVFR